MREDASKRLLAYCLTGVHVIAHDERESKHNGGDEEDYE